MPFGINDAVVAIEPSGSGFGAGDLPVGGTKPTARRAQDIGDAIIAGLQNSATGLAFRGKLPEMQLGQDAPWYHRLAANAAGIGADVPLMAGGAVAGAAAGAAVTGPAAPAGAAFGGVMGSFAAPMALRDGLIAAYNHDHAMSWAGAWDIAKSAMIGGAKGAVIGAATGGAGRVVAPLVEGAVAKTVAATGAELVALTATSAAVNQHMPTWQDFMDNAILLGGMKAAVGVAKAMRNTYAETGKLPDAQLGDALKDPELKAALLREDKTATPEWQHMAQQKITELKNEPMWFSKIGNAFFGNDETIGTFTAKLDFKKPLVESDLLANDALRASLEKAVPTSDAWFFARDNFGMKEFGMAMPEGVKRVLENKGYDGIIVDKTMKEPWAIALRPREQVTVVDRGGVFADVPTAYAPLALEERIKAAVSADPRPEMIRKTLAGGAAPTKLGDPSATDPVKYEYIADKETSAGVLRAVTELYQNEILQQTRGVVTNKATAVEAMKEVAGGNIGEHVVGDAANAAEIYARAHMLRGATNEAFTQLQKLAGIPEAELTPAAKLEALASLERVSMLKAEVEGVGAEAGRALQIFRTIKRDPSYLGDAEMLLKIAERKGNLQDIAKLVSALKDPSQLAEFARRYTEATTTEKVLEGWKAAILSGPQTHLANILGNMMKWGVELPENMISATLTAAERLARGDPLSMAQWKARAFAPIYGLQMGAADALHVAAEVIAQKGAHLEKADVYRTAIEGKKGEIIRLPFRVLQAEDALFRTVGERAESHIVAVDRAKAEGLHPDTAEYREAIVNWTQHPEFGLTEKQGLAAIERVQQAGAESVFSQRLGPRLEMMQRATAGHWSQFIVPFVRTPVNLVSWAIQHTPGFLLSARWRADWAAGGEAQAKAVSRVILGTGLSVTAYSLAQQGLMTGGGLFDKEDRLTKQAAGWQPYSLKIGDKWYSYQRIEPLAKVLGLASDLVELSKSSKLEEDRAKAVSMLVLMFGNATISTTYLSGLSNAMQSLIDPERYGENFLEQYASSVVPKAIGQAVALHDPYKREVNGILDAMQSQLPFLREKLLPKRDVWGEPVRNDRWFSVMPVAMTQASQDKVRTEAARLEIAIADAPKFLMERGPFKPREERNKLTEEQRDIFRQVSGKSAMEILSPIVNADDWSQIPDFAKAAVIKHVIEATRKQGQYAALPPDAQEREKIREKIVNKIIQQTQAVEGK